jgi:hypothetical protein
VRPTAQKTAFSIASLAPENTRSDVCETNAERSAVRTWMLRNALQLGLRAGDRPFRCDGEKFNIVLAWCPPCLASVRARFPARWGTGLCELLATRRIR